MIEALISFCAGVIIFEAALGLVSLIEMIPPVRRFVDSRLAQYPDDEEDF